VLIFLAYDKVNFGLEGESGERKEWGIYGIKNEDILILVCKSGPLINMLKWKLKLTG